MLTPTTATAAPLSYRAQVQRLREDTIVTAVHRLLVRKGYDGMTVDEVAAEAGLSKASLYKQFASKEELAAAAMARLLERALEQTRAQREHAPQASAIAQIEALLRWTARAQIAGTMPTLPHQNSRLVAALQANRVYLDRLMALSEELGAWIIEAQQAGDLDPELPGEFILYTLFARACDPVLSLLHAGATYGDEQLEQWLVATTLRALAPARKAVRPGSRR